MIQHLLIAGGEGQLGREFPALATASTLITCCGRAELDITDIDSIRRTVRHHAPTALINAAAYTAVDRAESEERLAFAINAQGTANLARVAQEANIPLLHVSTDYVFSGNKPPHESWQEIDSCEPQTVYGRSKLEGERLALSLCENSFILRTSWVFGRFGANFPKTMLRLSRERDEIRVVSDQFGKPTYAADIAQTLLQAATAMQKGTLAAGIYHYSGTPACSWFHLAATVLQQAEMRGWPVAKLVPIATKDYPTAAKRPINSVLDCSKLARALGIAPASWRLGVEIVVNEAVKTHQS